MSVWDFVKVTPPPPAMAYNTGTLFDLMVGRAIQGMDGHMYIDGGLGPWITAFHGTGNQYKSTNLMSLMMRMKGLYPKVDGLLADNEGALLADLTRVARMSGELNATTDNMVFMGSDKTASDILVTLNELVKAKVANRKDFTIQLPIVDPATGKAAQAWLPTLVFIDSLSNLKTTAGGKILEKGLDDDKTKTIFMADANQKTVFLSAIRSLCDAGGLVVGTTAHFGATLNLDSYGPQPKVLQHMKQGHKPKNVGSKFEFLSHNMIQCMGASACIDAEKTCKFKMGDTPDTDLNEVNLLVQRCKTNASGNSVPFVVSQSNGLLADVTNYNFLRNNGYFGLNGSEQRHQPFLMPDKTVTRNTFREVSQGSYEFRRAIELAAQWLFIKTYWNVQNVAGLAVDMSPQVLFERLQKDGSIKINDLLNSRGTWTYGPTKDLRPYMSIFEVIAAVSKS